MSFMSDLSSLGLRASQQATQITHVLSPLEKKKNPFCPLLMDEQWFINAHCSAPAPRAKGSPEMQIVLFLWEIKLQKGWSWALAAPFRDQLWLIGLERSPFPCIVWGLQFLQYLSGIPCGTQKQQKGIKTS